MICNGMRTTDEADPREKWTARSSRVAQDNIKFNFVSPYCSASRLTYLASINGLNGDRLEG